MRNDWSQLEPAKARELFEEFRASVPSRVQRACARARSIDPTWEDTKDERGCSGMIRALASVTFVELAISRKPTKFERHIAFVDGKPFRLYGVREKYHVSSVSRDALIDAGAYMGDCMIGRYPQLRWGMVIDRRCMQHQRPCVKGEARHSVTFDPGSVLGHMGCLIKIGSLDILDSWVEEQFEIAGLTVKGCTTAEFNAMCQKYSDRNAPTWRRWIETQGCIRQGRWTTL